MSLKAKASAREQAYIDAVAKRYTGDAEGPRGERTARTPTRCATS